MQERRLEHPARRTAHHGRNPKTDGEQDLAETQTAVDEWFGIALREMVVVRPMIVDGCK